MTKGNPVVGFIGLGLMGHGIASNVQKSGRPVIFCEHQGIQPVEDLVAKGAKPYKGLP